VSDESKQEERSDEHRSEKKTEERSEVTVVHEPEPGRLQVEDCSGSPQFHSLADAFAQRGFFENRNASVTWDEFRSFTWSAGTVLTDLNPVCREGVPLGYDQRWLYPVLPTTGVDQATTAIQYLREASRTTAGTAPLTDTSTKPETSTTVEYQTLQLNQVATVSSNIPRILAAQPMFQSLVESDLRLSISDGLDEVVRRGVATAGTAAAVTGDILEKTRRAMTVVQSNGYNPNVLAIEPGRRRVARLAALGGYGEVLSLRTRADRVEWAVRAHPEGLEDGRHRDP
jgi:hypothetical protein